ncbi:MAG: hypothetical protein COZ18_17055 [Flexibacter sp. CG_4_10_14_3_um_filter_32_15]|nr:MAG: hypothetical protein COZ18_17055 [Flexibacter sp. CG_4_10_14_3_um_filter_32_15]
MALEKYMLKKVEKIFKSSKITEVLDQVHFKIGERVSYGYFVISVSTFSDIEERTHKYFEHRIVDEKRLNPDFKRFIMNYNKSIEYNGWSGFMQDRYLTDWTDQHAVIAKFKTREECKTYIDGLWDYIVKQFE